MNSFEGINVLSLFDGMSCGQLALQRAGLKCKNYFASEIDKNAIKVCMKNFPNTIQVGNVLDVKSDSLPQIDLIIGGSPCQGFSFAGKQLNFEDPRSKLFFEFVRLLKECKPKYFLLENVCMKKEYEDVISGLLGVNPIMINSSLVSAQNRKRLYWTNIPHVTQPEDKGTTWGDVKEKGVNSHSYYYTEKALFWLAQSSRKHNRVLTVHQDSDKMQMIEAYHCKKYSNQRFFGIVDLPNDLQAVAAIRGRCLFNGKRVDGKMKTEGMTTQYIEFRYDKKTNCISTVSKDNIVVPFTLPNRVPVGEFFFRYITPLECERLQTVPDNYTDCVSDTQRYKMLGNGWTVDVIAHILKGINE
ncbi:MAG: DNA (cytosine-5-)-methyltransferase [Paludibacteraceae bacterium]|nr:DNA (cytosine-5-)-methyltransferase [Paludibacteraceae bacterium]